jgi:hypothetical protein
MAHLHMIRMDGWNHASVSEDDSYAAGHRNGNALHPVDSLGTGQNDDASKAHLKLIGGFLLPSELLNVHCSSRAR